jgi:hypothetical protein
MKDETIKITFKAKESQREKLQVLAARARMTQTEFILTLISDYGETLVQVRRQPTFVPESGLPNDDDLKLYWLTDGDKLFDSKLMRSNEFLWEQMQTDKQTCGNLWWVQSDKEPDVPRCYGFPNTTRYRSNEKSGFAPGDHTVIQYHHGDGNYQQLEIPFAEQE